MKLVYLDLNSSAKKFIMRALLFLPIAVSFFPLSAQAMRFELQGSSSKMSYDVVKHIPFEGAVPVHGELAAQSAANLRGALTTTDAPDAQGLYSVNGRITLAQPYFTTDSSTRDRLVHEMIDANGITVDVSNVRSSAQSGGSQSASVQLTINGITQVVPLTYVLIVGPRGSNRLVTMRGQMIVNRSRFNMSIHGIAGLGDGLIDQNFILKFDLPFRN